MQILLLYLKYEYLQIRSILILHIEYSPEWVFIIWVTLDKLLNHSDTFFPYYVKWGESYVITLFYNVIDSVHWDHIYEVFCIFLGSYNHSTNRHFILLYWKMSVFNSWFISYILIVIRIINLFLWTQQLFKTKIFCHPLIHNIFFSY